MERGRYTLSEEGTIPAQHLEPRRSCPPHRLGTDSVSSHRVDDALWHRGTARRVGSLANPRYRQPTHGHPHPRRERLSGPRCHAQPQAAGCLARILARLKAQTLPVVVPRGDSAIQRTVRSPPRPCITPAARPPDALACRIESIPTPCATVSRRTCLRMALTCAPFSCCQGITIWKKPPSTCICPNAISAPPPAHWTPWSCPLRSRNESPRQGPNPA